MVSSCSITVSVRVRTDSLVIKMQQMSWKGEVTRVISGDIIGEGGRTSGVRRETTTHTKHSRPVHIIFSGGNMAS